MTGPAEPARPRLTDEQRRPLEIAGASVALSAGAGCGKTTVLTERFLAALEASGVGSSGLKSLVALTFTDKAARELRQRIRQACHERLAASPPGDAPRWRSVLRGLEAAPVSTFHGYCGEILRRHALSAGIDPQFQVLDASVAASVLEEALARCLRRRLAEADPDLVALAADYGLARVRDTVFELVSGRDADGIEAWVSQTEDDLLTAWQEFWEFEGRRALARPLERAAEGLRRWLETCESDHPKIRAFRGELLDVLPGVKDRLDADSLATLSELAYMPRGLKAADWPWPGANAEAKTRLEGLRKAIDVFREKDAFDEDASRLGAAHGLRFARLAADARGVYEAAKRARGGLDFDDLLTKTRDLLRRDADAVREGIGFILVDEFQDTDPVQSEMLRALGGDGFADGRLFVVGDFKQSIYGFRGARPSIFQEFRAAFPAGGRLTLSENFRSASGVIDFVNALFAEAFPGESPRLRPGPKAARVGVEPAVAFLWADEPAGEARKLSATAMRRVEARWLARTLKARVEAGWPVLDRKTGAIRNAHGGDVAFLFRAMTDLAPYEQALRAEGFDYHTVGGAAFYAQQEIQDLVNVLSVVEDPFDAVALAGALRGPFFGLSDAGLFWLGGGGLGRGELADGLARSESVANLSGEDRRRAVRARGLLNRWRSRKDRVSIASLVDSILDESGFEASLPGEFLGDRKRANARKLVRLARRYDARGGFTLGQFVGRLRADLRTPPREDQAATTDEEGRSVRLLTIHQSKGLEFPIVVVPDLNRKPGTDRAPAAFHPKLGPVVRLPKVGDAGTDDDESASRRSLGWVAYEAVAQAEEDAEALRLFYVAATRARDALILSAGLAPGAKPASPALRLLEERFDPASGRCLARLPEGWGEPVVRVVDAPPASASPGRRERPLKPKLRAVARVIHSARPQNEANTRSVARPRFVDLDDVRGLSPRNARLDRLIRAILADPRAFDRDGLAAVAREAARRQVPVARDDLRDEALDLIGRSLTTTLRGRIVRAAKAGRGVEWTVPWGVEREGQTVFLGRAEFYLADDLGTTAVVVVSAPGASDAVERLRLLLAARAGEALGFGRVAEGWRIVPGGGVRGESDFGDRAVEAAVRAVLDIPA